LLQSGFEPAEASLACWRVRAGRDMSWGDRREARLDGSERGHTAEGESRAGRSGRPHSRVWTRL